MDTKIRLLIITDRVKTTAQILSVLSGLLAALCGLVWKLGLDSQATALADLDSRLFEAILPLLQILWTLLLKCAMVTLYTKTLYLASVSAEASLFSFVIFRETFSYQWLIGSVDS